MRQLECKVVNTFQGINNEDEIYSYLNSKTIKF